MSLELKTIQVGKWTFELYAYKEGDNVWLNANEVAACLGYQDSDAAIRTHVFECNKITWKNVPQRGIITPLNWQLDTMFINEAGMYQLMLRSKLPEMEWFQKCVTSNLLPAMQSYYQALGLKFEKVSKLDLEDITSERGYIYVATADKYEKINHYRIGSTTNVEKRMAQLTDETLHNWRMIAAFETSDRHVDEIKMLDALKPSRHCRDFFTFLSPIEALNKCKHAYMKIKKN